MLLRALAAVCLFPAVTQLVTAQHRVDPPLTSRIAPESSRTRGCRATMGGSRLSSSSRFSAARFSNSSPTFRLKHSERVRKPALS